MNTNPELSPVGISTVITGMLVALINTGVAMLTGLGVVQWDTTQQQLVNGFAVALINLLVFIGSWLWTRRKVTPLADPKDEKGVPLVRSTDGMPTEAQTRSMARGK